jgi:Zn finger protein HypA/HybF involved in hydrogenase expression
MSAHPGERARKTGTFHCKGCKHTVRLHQGDKIPSCPCGSNEYDERTDEPRNKSSR